MPDPKKKDDTSEYSSSKAPETSEHAEERKTKVDERLNPVVRSALPTRRACRRSIASRCRTARSLTIRSAATEGGKRRYRTRILRLE